MKDHVLESLQHAASGKTAMAVGLTTASAPAWIDRVVSSLDFQNGLILLGAAVSISIVIVNFQSVRQRMATNKEVRRQERIRTAFLEAQAVERGISVD